MPAERLLARRLHSALGLPGAAPADSRPMTFTFEGVPYRAYLWTCTPDRSIKGRPAGEHKIQLILPGQKPKTRGSLLSGDVCTVLMGYCPDLGLFAAWEARQHPEFAYSSNVQTRDALLERAQGSGWAADMHRVDLGDEVRVAMPPWNVGHFLRLSAQADKADLRGQARLEFFLDNPPNKTVEMPLPEEPKARKRALVERATRDRRFTKDVRAQFGYQCAICRLQLGVIDAAHIVPVSAPDSCDEKWNGLALCPTHHRLFDNHVLLISGLLQVLVDGDRLSLLKESGLGGGAELVGALDGMDLVVPKAWEEEAFSTSMRDALERRIRLVRGGE